MKIAILGTGGAGKAFAARLTELGHEVMVGTRSISATLEKEGDNSFSNFLSKNPKVKLGTFEEAASFCEMAINLSKGANTLDVVKAAGAENLVEKILMDISNPLDFSKGPATSLIPELSNTNSLGEEVQRFLPGTFVVKTLNTMWNGLMLNPLLIANGEHVNYICGNDATAKKKVVSFLNELGWKDEWILDLGDISGARATEATLLIWLRVWNAKKTGAFNFKIVS